MKWEIHVNGLAAGAIDEQSLSKSALMVRFSHVAKTHPRGVISTVKNLGPDIKHGQVLTLLRPSACDKTTTLRTIAGLEAVNEGALYFKDRPDRPDLAGDEAARHFDRVSGHIEANSSSASGRSFESVWRSSCFSSTMGTRNDTFEDDAPAWVWMAPNSVRASASILGTDPVN